MSDLAITEKANYSARAGEVIAGNLARGAGGQFTSAGNAAGKRPPAQSIGAKRTARANAATIAAAKRAAAKSKPKKGKGGKKAAAKPKGGAAARRAEADKRRAQRAAEAEQRKATRAAEQAKKKIQRDLDKAARDQKRAAEQAKRTADRDAAKVARDAERAKRLALAEQRRAAKGGGGKGGAAKPKAKPDKTAEQTANRAAVQAATLDKAAFDALQELVSGKQPPAGPAVDALIERGLAERDTAGALRISQAGRAYTNAADQGDIGRANDAISRARDRVAARRALAARRRPGRDAPVEGAITTKQEASERAMFAKMGAGGGGSGGGGKGGSGLWKRNPETGKRTPTSDQRKAQQERLTKRVKITKRQEAQAVRKAANKAEAEARKRYTIRRNSINDSRENGWNAHDLVDNNRATSSYRGVSIKSGSKADVEKALNGKVAAARRKAETQTRESIQQSNRDIQRGFYDTPSEARREVERFKESATSYTVYKQANGRYRWIGVSSTAYQDRDGQYVSLKALQDDVARADQDGHYGPLRYWHMPGVDIGTTDYNAVVGRALIESGEISDDRVGAALAASPEPWHMSLGFLHGHDQPQGDTFTSIRRFERSILPPSAASNPFTSLQVYKGDTMGATPEEKIAKLKELVGDDLLAKLLAHVESTEKEAAAAGVRYKMQDGVAEVEEKAADGGMAAADEAAGEMEMEAEEDAGEAESILTQVEIDAIAAAVFDKLAPLLQATTKAAATQPDVIDRFLGAVERVEKEAQGASAKADQAAAAAKAEADKRAGEIATLKQRLAELEGDQPAGSGYRASQAAETVTQKQHRGPMEAEAFLTAADFLLK